MLRKGHWDWFRTSCVGPSSWRQVLLPCVVTYTGSPTLALPTKRFFLGPRQWFSRWDHSVVFVVYNRIKYYYYKGNNPWDPSVLKHKNLTKRTERNYGRGIYRSKSTLTKNKEKEETVSVPAPTRGWVLLGNQIIGPWTCKPFSV